MSELLSVETVFLTLLDYPMSYLEFVGTVLYLASVWLIAQRNVLTWPMGIASVLLYMALFYQIRLYSDTLEQLYYLGARVYGWWYWCSSEPHGRVVRDVRYGTRAVLVRWAVITAATSAALGAAMTQVHVWMPALFPAPAAYPYVDALTTVMSMVAMWLMARKQVESWVYWIVVDAIGIWLYFVQGVRFVSLLYAVLLVLAIRGLIDWSRARQAAVGLKLQA